MTPRRGYPTATASQPQVEQLTLFFGTGTAEATRARRENLVLMSSEYEQPFGTFTGTLEDLELREGFGVMERHAVSW